MFALVQCSELSSFTLGEHFIDGEIIAWFVVGSKSGWVLETFLARVVTITLVSEQVLNILV